MPNDPVKCQYRQLGNSGLRISDPMFRCMGLGDPDNLPWLLGEEKLCELVISGKVRYISASSMLATQMQFTAEKNDWTKLISMQNQYDLLYGEEEREINTFCNETGVGPDPLGAAMPGPSSLCTRGVWELCALRA
ncbi:hypothetical protein BJX64DRAFT_290055 [Aspergillus heterothallicus]